MSEDKKKTTKKGGKKATTKAVAKVETEKRKLVREDSPFTERQLAFLLGRTPKEHIYTRKGKGGRDFQYVTGVHIKKVLNYVFGWLWSFEITHREVIGNQVIIEGKLTINDKEGRPIITKMQYGRADVKKLKDGGGFVDLGNDFKAAATDCLKKCASEIGIASDVYGGNEYKEIQAEATPEEDGAITEETLDKILTYCEEKNVEASAIATKYKVDALSDLTEKTGQSILINFANAE